MIVFGVDPGTAVTGFGVISIDSSKVRWLDSGVIKTSPDELLPDRLRVIYDGLYKKMIEFSPERVCIESAFYCKNVHTTLILGHARGVSMLAAVNAGATVVEYAPKEVKKAVTGNGNAEKSQIEYMIKMLLSPPRQYALSDAYDALAIALCDFYCASKSNLENLVNATVKSGRRKNGVLSLSKTRGVS